MTDYDAWHAVASLMKAGAAAPAYPLHGRLYMAEDGRLLCSVPSALVKGMFDAIAEPGAELPVRDNRTESAITVMTKDEVDRIGPDRITERGHHIRYRITGMTERDRMDGHSKRWILEIAAPDLSRVRKSYGLTSLPFGDRPFHITIAVRRTGVLHENDITKTAAIPLDYFLDPDPDEFDLNAVRTPAP